MNQPKTLRRQVAGMLLDWHDALMETAARRERKSRVIINYLPREIQRTERILRFVGDINPKYRRALELRPRTGSFVETGEELGVNRYQAQNYFAGGLAIFLICLFDNRY